MILGIKNTLDLAIVALLHIFTHSPSISVFHLISCCITSADGTASINNLQTNLDVQMVVYRKIVVF
jgi:hypothetical protein